MSKRNNRFHARVAWPRLGAWTLAALLTCAGAQRAWAADAADGARHEVRDPYYGQSLFDFFQDRYFSALTDLMVSQHFGRLPHHTDEAEILRGGLYLSYGLHREAAEIFTRLIDQGAPPAIRDRAWFYLAKIRYQRGLLAEAEQALDRIRAPLPAADLELDRVLLKGNLLMQRGEFAGAAEILRPLATSDNASLYARYNLGVALVKSGSVALGSQMLDEVGTVPAKSEEFRSLRDKANVALGFAALQDKDAERAKVYLERVRLSGMMSNKALLGYGWAADTLHDPKSALVSWMELSGRDAGDAAVLESKLAVPYALSQIGSDGQALEQYGAAIAAFDEESTRLDDSIAAIRAGKLVDGLIARNPGEEMGWFWNIDQLPQMRHGAHLVRVLSMHEFQEGFKNYRDLLFLERNLHQWETKLDVLGDMLANRRQAFAERLPRLAVESRSADLDRLDARRDALGTELTATEQQGDGAVFANARERALAVRLERARAALARLDRSAEASLPRPAEAVKQDSLDLSAESSADPSLEGSSESARNQARARLQRVAGALAWQLGEEMPQRLWQTKKNWKRLTDELAQAHEHQTQLVRAQQEEPQRFDQFATRIAELQRRILALEPRVEQLIAEQRQAVQELAVAELEQQKEDLVAFSNQARFAYAQIYDRAGTRGEPSRAQGPENAVKP
jgi:hypothetical protein